VVNVHEKGSAAVAEDRRGQRPSRGGSNAGRGGSTGGRGGSSRGGSGSRSSDSRGGAGRGSAGDARGRGPRDDKPRGQGGSSRGGYQGKPGGKRPSNSAQKAFRGRSEEKPRTADQAAYDGPDLPEDVTGAELDRGVRAQLKGLPEKLAARVARHLAAAGRFIDENPELAYQHALAARARASRIAVVREAAGETAYAAGHYAEALAELRAAKRMNGATDYLPIMADCHRALGNPEQAIKLAKSPSVANFSSEAKAEMTLVEAGARRDMGQLDAALRTLELAPLTSKSRAAWVVRLRYAYADTLEAAGRESDALAWFHRTHAIDSEELTDSAERAELLEKRQT
jgi:tetratricopeptide (TPR) repeat protein